MLDLQPTKGHTVRDIIAARRRKGVVVRVNTMASGQAILGSKSLDLSRFVEKVRDMKTFGLEVRPGYVVARGSKTFGPVHPSREAAETYLRELAWELQREQQAKDEW